MIQELKQWAGGIVLLAATGGIGVTVYFLLKSDLPTEVRLPVLAIVGVIALLMVLAMVAGAFTLFNLANAKEALGLPEGSVRAVIALSLIVLFAILTVYLYTDLSQSQVEHTATLTTAAKDALVQSISPARVIATIQDPATQSWTVYYQKGNPAAEDFAKQLLIMIGTLVTSVASFYFGTKSSSVSGETPLRPKPALRNITPPTMARDIATDLQIAGDGLGHIKEVKITLGSSQVVASRVTSSASLVRAQITVPLAENAGAWAVIATDDAGQSAQLPVTLAVT